jgi:metal-responsive CopG/Arc/MetJ family transcriptional regulator
MAQSSQKRRISVTIDADLLSVVDQLTDNRSAAFEEALRLWRAQKLQDQLKTFYQQRSQSAADEEIEWVRDTQDGAIAHWNSEFPWEDEASS